MKAIDSRRSVRSYLDKEVEEEKLLAVLEAGRLAPSAKNRQAWHFYVVTNPETKHEICVITDNQAMVDEAPVCIVVVATDDYVMGCKIPAFVVDSTIALSFMMVEASEQGLGTCWIGKYNQDQLKALLNLSDNETVIGLTPLGYPKGGVSPKNLKSFEDIVTYIK